MKRIIFPLLVCLVSLSFLPNYLPAEKRGKDVVVCKLDGIEVTGELIAVKADSLLLLEKNSLKDLKIQVPDINTVKLIRRSKPLKGALIGFASAAVIGGTLGVLFPGDAEPDSYYPTLYGAFAAPVGAVIGLITSGLAAYDSTYLFKGRPQYFKEDLLRKLGKHARIKDAN